MERVESYGELLLENGDLLQSKLAVHVASTKYGDLLLHLMLAVCTRFNDVSKAPITTIVIYLIMYST